MERHGGRAGRRRAWPRAAALALVVTLLAATTPFVHRDVDDRLTRLLDHPAGARDFLTSPYAPPVLGGDDGGRVPGAIAARLVLTAAEGPDAEVVPALGLIMRHVAELGTVPDVVAQALATAAYGHWAALFDAAFAAPPQTDGLGPRFSEQLTPLLDHQRAVAITVVGMYDSALDRIAEATWRLLAGDELRGAVLPATWLFVHLSLAAELDRDDPRGFAGRVIGATWWLRPAGARDRTTLGDAVNEVLAGARGDGVEISGKLSDFVTAEVQYELEAALLNARPLEERYVLAATVLDDHDDVVVPAASTPAREEFLRWRAIASDVPEHAAFLDHLYARAADAVTDLASGFDYGLDWDG